MTETDISTKAQYYDYVNFTVDCIIEEYNQDSDVLSELVFESADSANIVLYFSYNMDILQNSNEQPEEWKHLVSESDSWKEVIQVMAFDVFRQDLWNELHSRDIELY